MFRKYVFTIAFTPCIIITIKTLDDYFFGHAVDVHVCGVGDPFQSGIFHKE
jgi:hypothetical protein